MSLQGVYILRSSNGRYYIGSTDDLERRLSEHQRGHVKSTRNLLPVILVLFQGCDTISLARKVEYKIKQLKSKKLIEKWIEEGRIEDQYMQP
ncbi:GIY-YIG nuclease family protein [Candidatus Uhrbacteria bacterium]|nr:GIY-YIG nuclease family protein [Candidatus Uhrbacteria bacterium]